MDRTNLVAELYASRLVAVIRSKSADEALALARAAAEGGIKFVEITFSVPGALDVLIRDWASAEHQRQFRALIKEFDSKAVAAGGKGLLQLSPQQRTEVIAAYDAEHFSKPPYSILKNLVLRLYYFSEIGAMQELRYEHVPGAWEPAVKVTAETRTWASSGPI